MMEADWSDLPSDLVTAISVKASTTTAEYLSLRAVCKPWRRVLPPRPCHLPREGPWLLLPPDGTNLSFYDLERGKTHRFELPFVRGKHICGSSHGWLVLQDKNEVSLLNPITGSSIDLPSFDARSIIEAPRFRWNGSPIPLDRLRKCRVTILKAILSCNPFEPGCVVVVSFNVPKWKLGVCRIGDAHWTELKHPNPNARLGPFILDFTCHNHLVYIIDNKKEVTIYDLENHSKAISDRGR